jgi:hypothetical protein
MSRNVRRRRLLGAPRSKGEAVDAGWQHVYLAPVVKVAAGLESTDRHVPVRDMRHEALDVLVGKWINEGRTVATAEIPSVPI